MSASYRDTAYGPGSAPQYSAQQLETMRKLAQERNARQSEAMKATETHARQMISSGQTNAAANTLVRMSGRSRRHRRTIKKRKGKKRYTRRR